MHDRMRDDQRVLELEFLARLERRGGYLEMSAIAHEQCGLTAPLFKDLVLTLLFDHCVTGSEPEAPLAEHVELFARDPRWHLWRTNEQTVRQVLAGRFPYMLRISHLGLVRLARLREEIDRGRILDPTGILNDARYIERDLRIRQAMNREGASLSLLTADLDHFKAVNDRLGHTKGDEALRRYFSIMREVVSTVGGDAYRRGGDETVAILPATGGRAALEAAEAVRSGVKIELEAFGGDLLPAPTVSIGVLTLGRSKNVKTALEDVDRLLYRAKEKGRDRVEAEAAD